MPTVRWYALLFHCNELWLKYSLQIWSFTYSTDIFRVMQCTRLWDGTILKLQQYKGCNEELNNQQNFHSTQQTLRHPRYNYGARRGPSHNNEITSMSDPEVKLISSCEKECGGTEWVLKRYISGKNYINIH